MVYLPVLYGFDLNSYSFGKEGPPPLVYDIEKLKWLRLARNQLPALSNQVFQLSKLQTLDVRRNNLSALSNDVTNLKSLEILNCRNNNLTDESVAEELFDLPYLFSVNFSSNNLEYIPSVLYRDVRLRLLILSCNEIAEIPGSICEHLGRLLYLDMRRNALTVLPPQIRRVEHLEHLDVSYNNLETITRSVVLISTMRIFKAAHNRIKTLPAECTVHWPATLVHLDLSDNPLESIPEPIVALLNLRRLSLAGCNLKMLSSGLRRLKLLESLNVSRNQLTAIPAFICELTKLRRLLFGHNLVNSMGVPTHLRRLLALKTLNLRHNNLSSFPIECLPPSLTALDLSINNLSTLSPLIYSFDLTVLNIEHNPHLVLPRRRELLDPSAREKVYQKELEARVKRIVEESNRRAVKLAERGRKIRESDPTPAAGPDDTNLSILESFHSAAETSAGKPKLVRGYSGRLDRPTPDRLRGRRRSLAGQGPSTPGAPAGTPHHHTGASAASPYPTPVRDPNISSVSSIPYNASLPPNASALAPPDYEPSTMLDTTLNTTFHSPTPSQRAQGPYPSLNMSVMSANFNLSTLAEEEDLDAGGAMGVGGRGLDLVAMFGDPEDLIVGHHLWVIENLEPFKVELEEVPALCEGDCYIVLRHCDDDARPVEEGGEGHFRVHYWVGRASSLDKRACAAMQAVFLSNHINAQGPCQREEDGNESGEFLSLFPMGMKPLPAASALASGLYSVAAEEEEECLEDDELMMFQVTGTRNVAYIPVEPCVCGGRLGVGS